MNASNIEFGQYRVAVQGTTSTTGAAIARQKRRGSKKLPITEKGVADSYGSGLSLAVPADGAGSLASKSMIALKFTGLVKCASKPAS
jgi:hypothetical protein